jgi:hypothetical protein
MNDGDRDDDGVVFFINILLFNPAASLIPLPFQKSRDRHALFA